MRLIASLVLAGLLALLNLANLAGAGYARFAENHLDRPGASGTQAAARIAARGSPWSSSRAALQGWVHAENRDAAATQAAYRQALRLAPGDALLWAEYGLALARIGQFDAQLTLVLARAVRLAPTSDAVGRSIAELGLSYWPRGTPEQQGLWLAGMRAELARSRGEFLGHVLTRGQGKTFCRDAAHRLGEERWCASMTGALRDGCYQLTAAEPVPCATSR